MAKDNKQIALDVLEAVGGVANVVSATHCMTRLRLVLKDESIPVAEEVAKIPGVIGSQWSGGQYQVIIGQNVPKVYNHVVELGVTGTAGGGAGAQAVAAAPQKLTPKAVGESILSYLSHSMVPLIPMMLTAAMFRTVGAILGPSMLGVLSEDSATYNLLYNWLFNAGFYFLPFYLGYSAAKALNASPVLGIMLGGVFMAPELAALVEAGEASTVVYGFIPAGVVDYSTTVLPILLSVAIMAPVERFFKKVVPDVLATVFVPFLTIAVMVPIALCAVGPIGSAGGTLLGNFFFTLSNAGGIWTLLTCVALGALWMFMVMTGMHIVLVMMAIPALATNGYDACVLLTLFFANASVWGIALGGFAKLKNKAEKGEFLGFFLAGLLGGVTEPTLFGCGFKYNRTLVCMALGGAVGSLVGVLMGAKVLVTTYTSIFMVLAFVGSDVANIVAGATGIAVSVLVAAAATYFFGFTKEQLAQDEREARLFEEQLKNRGKKVAPALNE